PPAPAPGLLEGPGSLLPGALRAGARGRAPALCLHAVRCGPPPLHRRDTRALRDARAPVQGRAALSPEVGARQAARARGADQPAHPFSAAHEAGTPPLMNDATTLTELIEANRTRPHRITYLEGENQTREVSFAELYERSLGILYHLQRLGARRGDKLILFLTDNEQFIDAFWAAVLGGIVPVPVALGISDEHRMKLLRIARRLGKPFLYTERRSLERIGAFAAQAGEEEVYAALRERTFLVDDLDDISRAGSVQRSQAGDTAFIQFSSGSTSEPKGVVLTHGNILANCRGSTEVAGFGEHDVSLIFNGAEPISVELCEEFLGRLAPAKLNRNAMYPVYGLAEASLAVSFPAVGAPLRTITLNRHRMSAGSPVELVPASDRHAVRLVS